MKHWTIRRRIVVSFGVILALILVMGVVSLTELRRRSLHLESLPSLDYDAALQLAWIRNYLLTAQYVRLEDRTTIDQLAPELAANESRIDNLVAQHEASASANADRELLEKLKKSRAAYSQVQQQILKTSGSSDALQSVALIDRQLAPQFEHVLSALQDITELDRERADQAIGQIEVWATVATVSILTSFVAALVLATLLGYLLLRAIMMPLSHLLRTTDALSKGDFTQHIELTRRDEFATLADAFNRMVGELSHLIDQVQKSAIQVNASVTQIGATSNEQHATATEIAATTTEIGATSKEISATSRELVHTMNEVSAVAEQTAGLAGSGQAGMARMEASMQQVTEAAVSINAKLVVLNEKAGNINQVVTTITKIADQTNLLSLNAAIEAEKAGEAGRGFGVVATEIRRLADQTGIATYDIEQTVKEIQSAVAAGVMSVDKFSEDVRRGLHEVQQVGEQLSQIIHQVQTLAPRCVAVSEGMQAQATGAEQISDTLTQLTEASQQTVESLGQSNEAVGGLNAIALRLRESVSRFKLQAV